MTRRFIDPPGKSLGWYLQAAFRRLLTRTYCPRGATEDMTMRRYTPNLHDVDACNRRPFDTASCIAECLACGDTPEEADRAARILKRAHELKEDERVKGAIERCVHIRKYGRNPEQRYWR